MTVRIFRPSLPGVDRMALEVERALNALPNLNSLPTYANDAAAGVGGLIAGQFYTTASGQVMVKL